MSGSFTVGALAIARPEANAVGAVRLTLLPKRIEVELLLVGSYTESFVPGALTRSVRMSAPYTAVRGLVRNEAGVVLTFDPRAVTPYNRFVLTHFTDLPLEALGAAHRKRARAQTLATVAPLPIAIAAALLVPSELASGVLGRAALALVVLLLAAFALRLLVRMRSWGGPLSDRLRDVFEHRMAQRLAIEPAASFETDPFEPPPHAIRPPHVEPAPNAKEPTATLVEVPLLVREREPASARRLPRVTPELLRGMAFATLAVGMAIGGLAAYRAIERLKPGVAAVVTQAIPQETALGEESAAPPPVSQSKWPACACDRAESPLWKDGLPALTLIPISRQRDEAGRPASDIAPIAKKGVPRYDFDMAIVNDAAIPLKDVRVVLTFARRNKLGARTNVTDRGLFWEGELGPGRSVKWNVEAPGSEVRIDVDERRKLGEVPPAPADSFVKLLAARQASVRLHATMMLAYLGDARAHDAAEALADLSEADERSRQMVLRATLPLRVCDVKAADGALEACLSNTGDKLADSLDLVEIAPDGAGRKASLDESLPPHAGKRMSFAGFGEAPEELGLSRH